MFTTHEDYLKKMRHSIEAARQRELYESLYIPGRQKPSSANSISSSAFAGGGRTESISDDSTNSYVVDDYVSNYFE